MTATLDAETTDIQCIQCEYSLRGLDPSSKCPECGTPVQDTVAANGDKKLYQYENKILSRERSYRSNRSNAMGLAFLACLGTAGFFIAGQFPSQSSALSLVATFSSIPLWLAVAFANHARLKHVESIKHARWRG